MSINMNEEESEVAEGFTRVLRAASMSAMQLREAAEKRRQQAEKMSETERAQQAHRNKRVPPSIVVWPIASTSQFSHPCFGTMHQMSGSLSA